MSVTDLLLVTSECKMTLMQITKILILKFFPLKNRISRKPEGENLFNFFSKSPLALFLLITYILNISYKVVFLGATDLTV